MFGTNHQLIRAMGSSVPYLEFDQFFQLHHRLRTALDEGLKPLGLTFTSHQVLVAIKAQAKPYYHCTRMTVATALGLTRGTTSVLVSLLIKKGYVTEQMNDRAIDARRKQLRLTTTGAKAMHRGLVIREDVFNVAASQVTAPVMDSFLSATNLMLDALAQTEVSFED